MVQRIIITAAASILMFLLMLLIYNHPDGFAARIAITFIIMGLMAQGVAWRMAERISDPYMLAAVSNVAALVVFFISNPLLSSFI